MTHWLLLKLASHSLWWEMKCVRMRCKEPLCARSFSAPGQSGMSSAWYLAPGKGSSWLKWAESNPQRTYKMANDHEMSILTIYRFKFGWCCVGFHVEVLHPSSSAFIDSNEVYWLPLQFIKTFFSTLLLCWDHIMLPWLKKNLIYIPAVLFIVNGDSIISQMNNKILTDGEINQYYFQ